VVSQGKEARNQQKHRETPTLPALLREGELSHLPLFLKVELSAPDDQVVDPVKGEVMSRIVDL